MKTMTALAAVALGAMPPMAVTADVAELTLAIDGDSATVAAQAGALDPADTRLYLVWDAENKGVALFAANDAARAAMESRSDERSSRAEEKASGTTPELRKAVTTLLVQAAHRVNAVLELNPDNPNVSAAVSKVAALIEEYKQVAAQAKHRKGDTPAPEPEPTPEPTSEA